MLSIHAHRRWYHTGVLLKKGRRYRFVVPPGQHWKDWFIRCGPEGYMNPLVFPFAAFLRVRRAEGGTARFFTLVGTIGASTEHAFIIGAGAERTPGAGGELVCFANEVPWAYTNNHGSMTLTVEPLP